jgi:GTP-binding protein
LLEALLCLSRVVVPIARRGELFIWPGTKVYSGMIVGRSSRPGDIDVNVCKKKHLTSIRNSAGAEEALKITSVRILTLEEALEFIDDDELVEITPKSIRIRKRYLKEHERKRASREAA